MPALRIRDVFTECQKGLHSHGKLVKSLKKIYDVTDLDEFWGDFMYHLKFSMVIFKREPVVERTIEFAAKFAASLVQKPQKKDGEVKESLAESDEDDEDMHPFLFKFFRFLLNSHNANDKGVRFRVCQLINKLLNSMGEDAQIDENMYDQIYECMLQRLRDKFPIVRVHAVLALTRLQDPRDMDCPVINAYLFLVSCDTNPDVRRAVLSCIAASTKTLPAILERTRDTKDIVRKLAYEVIAEKIHIKALTIAQRVRLLQEGLNDRIDIVKDTCASRLLQSWLRIYEGNILEMLKCLDVENSLETSEQALMCMLKKAPISELVANFDILNEECVIPIEELTTETVTYWRCLCEHLISLGIEGEEHLDKVLPTGTNFSKYVKSVLERMKGENNVDVQLQNEFILQQLLQLAASLDLSDEVGRRHLQSLLKSMLAEEEITHTLVKPLLNLYVQLHQNAEPRINELIEVISDIRMPITTIESQVSKEEQRKVELKIAKVRVDLNQLREELDGCIQAQDFSKAAEIKVQVEELETTKTSLMDETMPRSQETRVEKTDAATLLKCLTIAAEMLQDINFKRLLPSLQTLIECLILPGIQNPDPAVRNLAVKALGLCCVVSKDTARAHLLLFIQVSQMDIDAVKVTALQVIFDLLLTFGMESFQVNTTIADVLDKAEEEDKDQLNVSGSDSFAEMTQQQTTLEEAAQEPPSGDKAQQSSVAGILTVLANLLDSEISEVRTVTAEGMAKLMLSGRVLSSKLFTRLLLLWYNPITEEDNYLRHCLGAFFPVYSFAGKVSQEIVEESFMPTLSTLFHAPTTSPIAEVNEANVAELLVQLTNHRHLLANQGKDVIPDVDSCPHDNIAIKLCNEILGDPNSFDVRTLCRILNMLELCPTNVATLNDLKVLVERMLKEVKDTQCNKVIEKFQHTILDMLTMTARQDQPEDQAGNEEHDEVFDPPVITITQPGEVELVEKSHGENKENVIRPLVLPAPDIENDVYVTAEENTADSPIEKPKSQSEKPKSLDDFVLEVSNGNKVKAKKGKKSTATPSMTARASTSSRRSKRVTATASRRGTDSDKDGEDDAFVTPVASTRRTTRARSAKTATESSESPVRSSLRLSTRKR